MIVVGLLWQSLEHQHYFVNLMSLSTLEVLVEESPRPDAEVAQWLVSAPRGQLARWGWPAYVHSSLVHAAPFWRRQSGVREEDRTHQHLDVLGELEAEEVAPLE
jgi:hypothetical protein